MQYLLTLLLSFCLMANGLAQATENYTYKPGDPNGIGKWYMDREIAYVMGYRGIGWLERSERENEENVSTLLRNLDIRPDDTIADIGAGSGYHVFRMAKMATQGMVYGVDIQNEMLDAMADKQRELSLTNITLIKGSEKTSNLPVGKVDKVLMVDVYHEFNFPVEMLASIKAALKPNGKVYLIEYRGEDDRVPIKRLHKMTEQQAVREMKAAGFQLEKNIDNLPWQHCMVFVQQ